ILHQNQTDDPRTLLGQDSRPNPSSNQPTSKVEIVLSAMTTLWTIGLKDQFEQGRRFIETELHLDKIRASDDNKTHKVNDLVSEWLGSLLSCYALTNDTMFRDRAQELAEALEPVYDAGTGW